MDKMNELRIQVIEKPNHVFICKIKKAHFYITFGKKYGTLKDALEVAKAMAWMVGCCTIYIVDNNGNIVKFEEN